MRVASIQMTSVENDKAAGIEKACECIRQCRGADLILLPEIWNIGFMNFDSYHSAAETREGPTLTAMRVMAREMRAFLHTGSFVEKEEDRYFNSSYVLTPDGGILANYRKIHLFGFKSQETQLLTPGDQVTVVDTPWARIGLATCFDLRFPELFRRMAAQGAEIFLVCSAWPHARLEHWLLFNRVRAIENQCYLISSNSIGMNQGVRFAGHSMVIDPWGTVVADGGDKETIIISEVHRSEVLSAREQFPGLAGRVDWLNIFGQAKP